ncbi:protein phosphatase 1 regulatory subunit 12A-like [Sphaeramia orbicularis]|uniref:protein phosphatase 1 regulatory subunit 12A-like n=1 Tax=Sphaeramia orbicularis TaxID=375764 RepID=UPI00117FDBAF|nr:protein phosphatase 1 regulatory subunit 12A-like [Sphaeramia orbicularis]
MQAFVPRLYLTPVRDEEAESQRKAKSRHARQTRRSTQGVTLTELKEAQKTSSLSPPDRQPEDGDSLDDRSCLRKGVTDDRRVKISLTESVEPTMNSSKFCIIDKQGNTEPRLETVFECPSFSHSSTIGSCVLPYSSNINNDSFIAGERWWKDENQNPIEDPAHLTCVTKQQLRRHYCDDEESDHSGAELVKTLTLNLITNP